MCDVPKIGTAWCFFYVMSYGSIAIMSISTSDMVGHTDVTSRADKLGSKSMKLEILTDECLILGKVVYRLIISISFYWTWVIWEGLYA